jgi:hypothetical protein
VQLPLRLPVGVRELLERRDRAGAGVVDQDVHDAAGQAVQRLRRVQGGHVDAGAARGVEDPRALGLEPLDDGGADAGAAAGDHRHAVRDPEVH